MPSPKATISYLGGATPLQGEGTLSDGRHFYFRARYEMWEMRVGATADAVISDPSWVWTEPWGDSPFAAGYMPQETGREIIESVAEMAAQGVLPPRELVGMPDDEIKARRLAQFILNDICTYQAEVIADAGSPRAARAALVPQIEEGRGMFRKRTEPRLHVIYEDLLILIDACAKKEIVHERWLLDEASARSVGRRWAFVAGRVGPARRNAVIAEGTRWLTAWTPEGKVREAWQAELR